MGGRATPRDPTQILLFNVLFFGTLAWLGSAADVAHDGGWWYELGQVGLALGGIVAFWTAWWFDHREQERLALRTAAPAVASLSVWLSTVHSAL